MAAIVAVLSEYPPAIMETVCDPRSGLPSRVNWLPTVAEVKSACNTEAARLERVQRYSAMRKEPLRIQGAVSTANVLVPHGLAMYAKAVTASQRPNADPNAWRFDEQGAWVRQDWALENGARPE